jgi:glycosyltransferase involved in cell wall biosynthesis
VKISFSTVPGNLNVNVGYGNAGFNMVRSLQRLGHEVPFQDPTAPVQIHFSQPSWYEFEDSQYKIGYTPWESSELPEGWLQRFNEVDEQWTPSPLVANWYKEAGVTVPLHVYEHGIDHIWENKRRWPARPLKFLHHGEPAPRKGGQMAVDAFRDAFGDSTDVHLTVKSHGTARVRAMDKSGNILGAVHQVYKNVTLIEETLDESELVALYHDHHALVYPGYGEGFGLIPLQAIASGMPTICTGAWAPYERLILPELNLHATLVDSPWPRMHPGKVYQPDYDNLVEAYKTTYQRYDVLAGKAFKTGYRAHHDYDWDHLTESAFAHVVEKFS